MATNKLCNAGKGCVQCNSNPDCGTCTGAGNNTYTPGTCTSNACVPGAPMDCMALMCHPLTGCS
jgi:hypothetical protein